MMRISYVLSCMAVLLTVGLSHAQDVSFLSAVKAGSGLADAGQAIDVDPSGNAVVTGFFRETASFGGLEVTSTSLDDIFVAKYDDEGNALWVVSAGGLGADEGRGVATDGEGNVFATGRFSGDATFGATQVNGAGSWDAFLSKYDPDGNLLWVRSIGGALIDEGYDVDVDPSGNVYVTGFFNETANVGDTVFTSAGADDIFLAKYDPSGNFIWAVQAGSQFFDQGYGVAVDPDGKAYISGRFSGTSTFGDTTITVNRIFNSYLAKYDANGNFEWVRKAGGRDDFSYGVDVDGSGNPVSVGYFQQNAIFGDTALTSAGSSDIYVAKYSPDGDLLWVAQAGSDDADFGLAVAGGADGSVLATGWFTGTATFGDTTLTTGSKDVFFARYDSDGILEWAANPSGGGFEEGHGVAFSASGNLVATGWFTNTVTFGDFELTADGTDQPDIFVTVFGADGGGGPTSAEDAIVPSGTFQMAPNYPNPFSESTAIPIELSRADHVRITLHDVLGRRVLDVADEILPAGRREIQLDATGIPAGVYLIRANVGAATYVRAVSILR